MSYFMKRPCEHCPFRHDVKPFLTNERAEQLAYSANNKYNTFTCHKTTVFDEESEEGEMMITNRSKECAGFMTLQHSLCGNELPDGFKPAYDICYTDDLEMIDAYEQANEEI